MLAHLGNCCDGNLRLLLMNHASCQGRDLTPLHPSASEMIKRDGDGDWAQPQALSNNAPGLEFQAIRLRLIRKCPEVLNATNDDSNDNGFLPLRKDSTSRNKLAFNDVLGSWIHTNVGGRFPSSESSKLVQHLTFYKISILAIHIGQV